MSKTKPQIKILNVGLAVPETRFSQKDMATLMGVITSSSLRFFEHDHINSRHLILPQKSNNIVQVESLEESTDELREKFKLNSISLIEKALTEALSKSQIKKEDIDYIVCVTSTGFFVPGLSALTIESLNLKRNCQRLDIVGMGCNAGLNGLNAVTNWCSQNLNQIGVLICCELSSCIYSIEDNENSAIVNSLFGDGVAVCLMQSQTNQNALTDVPSILDFSSHLIAATLPLLRFNWNSEKNKYSFFVDKKTPLYLAENISTPLEEILNKNKIKITDIKHWIVHSGGAAILDAIETKLGLDKKSFRHTRSVLKEFGNVSSGSFLFSYQNLLNEQSIKKDDYGLMITMGPGLTIEMALIRW